jgi:2-polyprenyl-3-methyl-5-hydroxy-6-metoxy-1,4-benzoquinol methylase
MIDMNQIDLISYSFKKKEKLGIIKKLLLVEEKSICFELGCGHGALSYVFRNEKGKWISADIDWENVKATKEVVQSNVIQVNPIKLPFKNKTFDVIVCIDFLEHIKEDVFCVMELSRVLKDDGFLLVATPTTGKMLILNKIKKIIGLTMEKYGHVREGYSQNELSELLIKANLAPTTVYFYSYFFTETIEMLLNRIYIMINKNNSKKRDGIIAPCSIKEYEKHKILFKLFKMIYPILWYVSRLDYLLKFLGAYAIIIKAKK